MSFGSILGQMLQGGLGGQSRDRLGNGAKSLDAGGSGLDGVLAQLQGAFGQAQAPGGFADKARDFMTRDQAGGMSGAQLGGIGALAGALLGGGVGGAARGGALAVLGTLAISALKQAQGQKIAAHPDNPTATNAVEIDAEEVAALTGPDAEKLLVRAMISAAKADGNIDQTEMEKIIGKVGDDGVTEAERAFVMSELGKPLDVAALAADVRTPAQAAEVYAASLVAIDVDSEAEKDYLRALARELRLGAGTVAHLHRMTGAPSA